MQIATTAAKRAPHHHVHHFSIILALSGAFTTEKFRKCLIVRKEFLSLILMLQMQSSLLELMQVDEIRFVASSTRKFMLFAASLMVIDFQTEFMASYSLSLSDRLCLLRRRERRKSSE